MTPLLTTSLAFIFTGLSPFIGPKPEHPESSRIAKPQKVAKRPTLSAKEPKVMMVRVTVYWRNGSGTDMWTAAGKSSSGRPLRDRRSAAVDPRIIPYGSKIVLPSAGKSLDAVDTGTDVKSRKAAKAQGRDVPVVDIYFESKSEALTWAKQVPMFMEAHVYEAE